MKEHPILFSAPMVRAILDGRKTQTRRIVKDRMPGSDKYLQLQDATHVYQDGAGDWIFWFGGPDAPPVTPEFTLKAYPNGGGFKCPYGRSGDRLWVKETFAPFDQEAMKSRDRSMLFYRADDESTCPTDGPWKPSIFMPRWASRIMLEVTGVRVQRLNQISDDDAMAEGAPGPFDDLFTPRFRFEKLWESINGPDSWEANPLVWVIEFKVTP